MAELRFAFRQLVKSPGFAFVAIFTLALGIGSATTAFTAVNALLLRPFPLIRNQERMIHLDQAAPAKGADSLDVCYADFLDWRARSQTLSALWVFDRRTVIISTPGQPMRRMGSGLSPGAFQAMGVQPVLGRDFRPEDDLPSAPPVAIIGHELWQSHFGGNEEVLGQSVQLNGQPTTIIGVMPPRWRYPEVAEIWMPLRRDPEVTHRGNFDVLGHAMLKPGVTLEQARAEFAAISAALAREFPQTNDGVVAVLRDVREEATAGTAHLTLLVFGAVMFVFLIACVNVANLLLARASARTKEFAIRLAVGAQRRQLVRQLLLESLLLGAAGALGGFIFALWGVDLMLTALPVELPFWLHFEFDGRVFGFIAALAIVSALLFGLVPAWQGSRPDMVDELKEAGRTSAANAQSHRLRNILVVAEIALALVLLVGAGLMMRSFLLLNRVEPGFDPRGVLTFRVGFPPVMFGNEEKMQQVTRQFFHDLLPRLAALPGVTAVSATSALPALDIGGPAAILREGEPEPETFAAVETALVRIAAPQFFETLRIPLRSGRTFTPHDDDRHPKVAVVDEVFARRYFPGQDPIGKRFRGLGKPEDKPEWLEVVGVVSEARRCLDRDEPNGTFYLPYGQKPTNFMTVVIRTAGDPLALVDAARDEVLAVNPQIPIYNAISFEQAIERSEAVWRRRFFGSLFTVFASVALLLAVIGIYGVMSFSVTQRTQEIGVRMALGAEPRTVIVMVLRRGVRLVAAGLGCGFVTAFFVAELLAGSLYGVSPHDPPTFAVVPALLAAIALLACYIPSRRAIAINPVIALRME